MTANYLSIYLNDHYAGANAGTRLARRCADAQQDGPFGAELDALAAEIRSDLAALERMMQAVGVRRNHVKGAAGMISERLGRLKPNGHVTSRSPLSSLLEVELLRIAIEGKACGWQTLRELAPADQRLPVVELDDLLARARDQADRLEQIRLHHVAELWDVHA